MKRLGDVCEVDKFQGIGNNLPYVGLEDIESNTGSFLGSTVPRIVKSNTFTFSQEHLLYGRLRPYLNKVMLPDFTGHCSTEIFPLKPTGKLSRNYLKYWFLQESTVETINKTSTGARMPRANINSILEFELPLPPLPEQQRIVAILDEAFDGIAAAKANAEKNLANARELFESYLNSVFSQRGDGWKSMPISELCHIKHGFPFKSEFFSNKGEYVVLTPGNFYESGGYRDRNEKQKFYSGEIPDEYVLNKGDLLVVMTEQAAGLLGSPMLVPESKKFLHNQRLGLVIKKTDALLSNNLFYHLFNTKHVRKEIHASASGVKVRHTSPAKIGQVIVSFPSSIIEQEQIVQQLDALREETLLLESIYQQKIEALDELKQSILHQAFSGGL